MKIACLCTRYNISGASTNAVLLAEGFAERGHSAEAWFVHTAGTMPPTTVRERTFLERSPGGPKEWANLRSSFLGALDDYDPDVVIGFHPLANAIGALSTWGRRHRFVATQRVPSDAQRPSLRLLDRLVGSSRLYFRNICVSNAVRATFSNYPAAYQSKLSVIHNCVRPLPSLAESKYDSRVLLGIPADAFVVGSIGRLHPVKNVSFLLDALKDERALFLAIAGEGPEEAHLQSLASDRVEGTTVFLGGLAGIEVARFYNAVDMLAIPSKYEGFGLTMVEALSRGVPVLASDISPFREIAKDVAILRPLELSKWKEALRSLAREPGARLEMAERGRMHARAFSREAMVETYLRAIVS